MLLLVPSHKVDDGMASNRVLVLLPSDTDLSSNVVVPDAAITTTLGTNDTLETIHSNFPFSPFSSHKAAAFVGMGDPPRGSRDYLGILQLSGPADPLHAYQLGQQPNLHRSPSNHHQDDLRSRGCWGPTDDQIGRSRRHSHTGLVVDGIYGGGGIDGSITAAYPRARSKTRQSFSQASPYQYQPVRRPRALRAAFRKARKDQSPLLTSTSFDADYPAPNLAVDMEDEEMGTPPAGIALLPMMHASNAHQSPNRASLGHGMESVGPLSRLHESNDSIGSLRSAQSARSMVIAGGSLEKSLCYNPKCQPGHVDSGADIDIDENEEKKCGDDRGLATSVTSLRNAVHAAYKRQPRASSEILDVDGLSDDEEMSAGAQPATSITGVPRSQAKSLQTVHETEHVDQDLDLNNTFDADMMAILGMASDMELEMPKFDDEYLDDLKNDAALVGESSSRRSSSASVGSPSCSHSSSSTITCISSHRSPRSHSGTPRTGSVELGGQADSLPASPSVIAARERMRSPSVAKIARRSSQSPHGASDELHEHPKDLSTIDRDIDNLRRHRDSLKQSSGVTHSGKSLHSSRSSSASSTTAAVTTNISQPSSSSSSLSSSSSSSSSSMSSMSGTEPKSQGPIYFKPTHHRIPSSNGSNGGPLRQNVMIIQSSQWSFDNKGAPTSAESASAIEGTSGRGNQVFRIQQSHQQPHSQQEEQLQQFFQTQTAAPLPPPPILDKRSIMTANNISMVTANMSVLTPQEVQEDYYARRNLRIFQQRQRRRSAAAVAAATAAAAGSNSGGAGPLPFRAALGSAGMPEGFTSPSMAGARRSSASDLHVLPHPLDKMTKPVVPAIGASPLPASYYIPPSAFRTEAVVAAEREAEAEGKRRQREEEESFLVFPSPTLS